MRKLQACKSKKPSSNASPCTRDANDPALQMEAEVTAAVKFLTDLLHKRCICVEAVDRFALCLKKALIRHYREHWYPTEPLRGSAYRCLRINGQLDPVIAKAVRRSQLSLDEVRAAYPAELSIWIDPGEVSVRFGEEGSVGVIHSCQPILPSGVNNQTVVVEEETQDEFYVAYYENNNSNSNTYAPANLDNFHVEQSPQPNPVISPVLDLEEQQQQQQQPARSQYANSDLTDYEWAWQRQQNSVQTYSSSSANQLLNISSPSPTFDPNASDTSSLCGKANDQVDHNNWMLWDSNNRYPDRLAMETVVH
ncbi:Protein BTG2 [Trichinella zimbabwensis]|uniref:Protein BTG2 n=1 Tax=Trichinella zimbabwensis TaxID=268475 RepID=A0A0V1HR00_9BILA|nr:Protein BTG2 [Trichinella zimbabwensis]